MLFTKSSQMMTNKKISKLILILSFTVLNFSNSQSTNNNNSNGTDSSSVGVNNEQISNVQNKFDELYLSSPYPDGFGIPLKAQALLDVVYPSGNVQLGQNYTAQDVSTQPIISVIPLSSSQVNFKAPNSFTLMLADANALGNPDPKGNYRHFLENGATFGDLSSNGTMTLNQGSGKVITSYAGPGPLPNEGPHRYAWMLFVQGSNFQAPSNLSNPGTGPDHWYVNPYVSSSKLGDLVAASFFTVENGHANFTPKPIVSSNYTRSNNGTSNGKNNTISNGLTNPASVAKSNDGIDSIGLNRILFKSFGLVTFVGLVLDGIF